MNIQTSSTPVQGAKRQFKNSRHLLNEKWTNKTNVFFRNRADCFTSDYFKGCVEALLLNENLDTYKKYIKHLHGADPKL